MLFIFIKTKLQNFLLPTNIGLNDNCNKQEMKKEEPLISPSFTLHPNLAIPKL
jgi:hypothetical protein